MNTYAGLTTQILTMVDDGIRGYTQGTYQAISAVLTPTLELSLLLYVIVFGIAHLSAEVPFSLTRSVRHMVVAAVVVYFVTRWDFFALYFGNIFTDGPAQLMAAVSGGSADPNAMLSDVFDKGIMAANEINKAAGVTTLGFLIVGYSLFYMTLACVGYALYLLILAKIALALLLGLAPLFFVFALFNTTRNFFSHYVRQVFNFALIPVFTAGVLGIMLKIPQQAILRLQTVLASHSGHGGVECVFALLSFFVLFGLLHQVTGFAAGISGGGLHLHPGNAAAFALGLSAQNLSALGRRGSANLGKTATSVKDWAKRMPFKAGRKMGTSLLQNRRPGDLSSMISRPEKKS